tara:strand:+ start:15498 stop:17117 length:1620 start_codon:yes stop_codon:yes gene_type:complete
MPAIVTDQFRILNANNFVNSVLTGDDSYYVFLGLSNPFGKIPFSNTIVGFGRDENWQTETPSPVDNLQYLSHYRDTMLFGKKINSANIRRVVKRHNWIANTRYDMYRHDYQTIINPAPNSDTGNLFDSNFYVVNSDFKVYVCIDNGSSGTNIKGNVSVDEPTFTDLEVSAAGTSGDGYLWKYLFTASPSDIIKFDSTEFIVLPNDWETSTDSQIQNVRESGNSDLNLNQIKKIYIENAGSNVNPVYQTNTYEVDILGDGSGGKAQIVVDTTGKISSAKVTSGGSGYTFAVVDLGTVQINPLASLSAENAAKLIPIIPPSKGHGHNIYKELGSDKVLIYARFDDSTKDFPTDTKFSQIGIIKNPSQVSSAATFTLNQFSSLSSLKLSSDIGITKSLIGVGITQSTSNGIARGYISSYDKDTKVLKFYQDRSLYFVNGNDQTDNPNTSAQSNVISFESSNESIISDNTDPDLAFTKSIDTNFSGITTVVNSKIINLGVNFTNGISQEEINKKTGDIIYIDNRELVERNSRQKEDVKIVLEF